jgi:hypothetical protein
MALSVSRRMTKVTVPPRLSVNVPAAGCVDTIGFASCVVIAKPVRVIAGRKGSALRKPLELTGVEEVPAV